MSSSSTSTSTVATGVLVHPSLSCALQVTEDTPIDTLIFQLQQQLTTKYNELIKPFITNKLGPLDLLIAVDGDMDRQKPISSISIPQSGKPLTMHFHIPQSHTFRVVLNKNKENLAQSEENQAQVLSKSSRRKQKKVASGSAVDRNTSVKEMIDRMHNEFTGRINGLTGQIDDLTGQIDDLTGQINDLKALRTEQDEKIKEQADEIKHLKAANAELSASDEKKTTTLQHHSTMLHSLHRRVLLDDARALMADRYGFPMNELRSGGQVVAGKPKTLSQLVDDVHSQLTDTDAHWLSGNALRMILDTRLGTLRSGGNAAAHCAFKEDLGLAIRDPSLHPAQRSTLKDIYMFTHNGVLDID